MHLSGTVLYFPESTLEACVQLCEARRDNNEGCYWGTFSKRTNKCFIGTSAPAKDHQSGKYIQVKCPQLHLSTPDQQTQDEVDNCHTFLLDEGARSFIHGATGNQASSITAKRAGWAGSSKYNFCSWSQADELCHFNDDARFARQQENQQMSAAEYSDPDYQWPNVQHDVVKGWTREQCNSAMKSGHHVQWRCEGNANRPYRIIKSQCPYAMKDIKAAKYVCDRYSLNPGNEDQAESCKAFIVATDDGTVLFEGHPDKTPGGARDTLCAAFNYNSCETVRDCPQDEATYDGEAFASSTLDGDGKSSDVFGCHQGTATGKCAKRWQLGTSGNANGAFIGYKFPNEREITRIAVWQYWRSGTCKNIGCCGTITQKEQYDGTVVNNFCEDTGGNRANFYCKKIRVEFSDDGVTWSAQAQNSNEDMVFSAQIGYNTFAFQAGKHSNWRMQCIDDVLPTEWQLNHEGIQLFETAAHCTNDGLGHRQWMVPEQGQDVNGCSGGGCCIAGCACYIGCSSITKVFSEAKTKDQCYKSYPNAPHLAWDGDTDTCSFTNEGAKQRCESTEDHLSLSDATVQDDIPSPCGLQQLFNAQAGTCEACPDNTFQGVQDHFLTKCEPCSAAACHADGGGVCAECHAEP